MNPRRTLSTSCALFCLAFLPAARAQKATGPEAAAAARMEKKLQHIEENGRLAAPDETPTECSEEEVNSYLASGQVRLPQGVESVVLEGQPGLITATAQVDFDELKSNRSSVNPLLSVFSGTHSVVVIARAHAAGGEGLVEIESVSLDAADIPRFVLQMFVEKFLKPKYPNLGLDSRFRLPDRVDTATVGRHTLVITQK
jgi:hypothetical protein